MRFSFYPGCTQHSTSDEYTRSTRAVMDALDVELVEIEDWNCCGAAATHSVNRLLSLCLPARNMALAQETAAGPLVIPCAGCFNMMKRAEHALRNDDETRRAVEEIVGFTFGGGVELVALLEAVVNRVGLERVAERIRKPLAGLRVACYYGCALVRNPEVTGIDDPDNPLLLDRLMAAAGAEPVQWSFKTDCCGADLALTHGEKAQELVGRIVGMAGEAGADCLVTSCGLCQANIELRQKQGMPSFYFTELLGVAMDVGDRRRWWKRHMISPVGLLKEKGLAT